MSVSSSNRCFSVIVFPLCQSYAYITLTISLYIKTVSITSSFLLWIFTTPFFIKIYQNFNSIHSVVIFRAPQLTSLFFYTEKSCSMSSPSYFLDTAHIHFSLLFFFYVYFPHSNSQIVLQTQRFFARWRASRDWGSFVVSHEVFVGAVYFNEHALAYSQFRFKTLVVYMFLSRFTSLEPLRFCKSRSPHAGTETIVDAEAAWDGEFSK